MTPGLVREFTVAVFVVHEHRILLLRHPRLHRWLPPGGHIEPNELPDDAAVREVEEETGVLVRLVGARGVPVEAPLQLTVPVGIQLEDIGPGHQHIDLVYFAVPVDGRHVINGSVAQQVSAGWYGVGDLAQLDLDDELRLWCQRAFRDLAT